MNSNVKKFSQRYQLIRQNFHFLGSFQNELSELIRFVGQANLEFDSKLQVEFLKDFLEMTSPERNLFGAAEVTRATAASIEPAPELEAASAARVVDTTTTAQEF